MPATITAPTACECAGTHRELVTVDVLDTFGDVIGEQVEDHGPCLLCSDQTDAQREAEQAAAHAAKLADHQARWTTRHLTHGRHCPWICPATRA